MSDAPTSARAKIVTWVGLIGSPILAVLVYALLRGLSTPESGNALSSAACATAAVSVWMVGWWLTEAVSLSVTSLIPVTVFPLLGVTSFKEAAAPYASDVIFLFGGGFILGLAMERWGLHRRIALITVLLVGSSPRALVGGVMLASGLISMWVSNTATAIMLLPIGLAVVSLVRARLGTEVDHAKDVSRFATCVVLAVAYGSSIGGVGTLIGTPPNLVFASFVRDRYGTPFSFVDWMLIGVPLLAVFLPLAWAYMVFVAFRFRLPSIPGGRRFILDELCALGPMSRAEWSVLIVFLLAVACWIFRPAIVSATGLTGLTDAGIVPVAAILLFVIPARLKEPVFVMDWKHAATLPWGVLLLFGGGLSLAAAMSSTKLDVFIGAGFQHLSGVPSLAVVMIIVLVVVFLSELASNTAVATALMPILAGAAGGLGMHPYLLLIPATLAASLAFMLPVGTPPNALAYSTGLVSSRQMAKAGLALNLMGAVLITGLVYFFGSQLLGIDLHAMTVP